MGRSAKVVRKKISSTTHEWVEDHLEQKAAERAAPPTVAARLADEPAFIIDTEGQTLSRRQQARLDRDRERAKRKAEEEVHLAQVAAKRRRTTAVQNYRKAVAAGRISLGPPGDLAAAAAATTTTSTPSSDDEDDDDATPTTASTKLVDLWANDTPSTSNPPKPLSGVSVRLPSAEDTLRPPPPKLPSTSAYSVHERADRDAISRKLLSMMAPHGGESFNPHADDYQKLVKRIVSLQMKSEEDNTLLAKHMQKLSRQVDSMYKRAHAQQAKKQAALQRGAGARAGAGADASTDTESDSDSDSDSDDDDDGEGNGNGNASEESEDEGLDLTGFKRRRPHVERPRVTRVEQNKKLRKVHKLKEERVRLRIKRLHKQIDRIKIILADLAKAKAKQEQARAAREAREPNPSLRSVKLGPQHMPLLIPDAPLPSDFASGAMRDIVPSTALFHDQQYRFQAKLMIEPRNIQQKRARAAERVFDRHKDCVMMGSWQEKHVINTDEVEDEKRKAVWKVKRQVRKAKRQAAKAAAATSAADE